MAISSESKVPFQRGSLANHPPGRLVFFAFCNFVSSFFLGLVLVLVGEHFCLLFLFAWRRDIYRIFLILNNFIGIPSQ
jgi:hypothetical protein